MPRTRISTTVDGDLLAEMRSLRSDLSDAALLDAALAALRSRHRETEFDAAYERYEERPLDDVDEWGSLSAFREGAAAS